MTYAYPAVFSPDESGGYSVNFPDLDGCYTCGDDLTDALVMASDALPLVLCCYEDDGTPIPSPSRADDVSLEPGEFVNYVSCDTLEYRKIFPVVDVLRLVKNVTFIAHKSSDSNGNIVLSAPEIGVAASGSNLESAKDRLSREILSFASDYYMNLEEDYDLASLKDNLPYVLRALVARTADAVRDAIVLE